MQRSTMVLGATLAVLIALAALFLAGGTLSVRFERVTANAADYPSALASIREILDAGAAPQTLEAPLPEDPGLCRLEDVTLALYNPGLVSAEWVSVTVEGNPGDVAVYSVSGEGDTLPGRSTGTLNLKLIARTDSPNARTYRVDYYTFGLKRTRKIEC